MPLTEIKNLTDRELQEKILLELKKTNKSINKVFTLLAITITSSLIFGLSLIKMLG